MPQAVLYELSCDHWRVGGTSDGLNLETRPLGGWPLSPELQNEAAGARRIECDRQSVVQQLDFAVVGWVAHHNRPNQQRRPARRTWNNRDVGKQRNPLCPRLRPGTSSELTGPHDIHAHPRCSSRADEICADRRTTLEELALMGFRPPNQTMLIVRVRPLRGFKCLEGAE